MKHLLFVPAFALLAAMALVGCSDDNGGTDPRIPATSVVVDVTEQELHVGETLQLTATPTPANTTDKVQWTSDDPATATVSETGLVTAVALGSTSVKAVCGEVSATCVIRVVEPDPSELYDIISFEEEEGMTDIGGQKVTLGDIEVVGGFAEGVYSNVFWAKPYAEYGDPEGIMGLTIDLPLFTSDGNVWFGSYYCDCTGWGSQMDTWGGFVLSRNCNTSATSFDYADQFSVYAQSGANGSKTFAAAYCNGMMGGDYSAPTIVFTTTPRKVAYLYMAPLDDALHLLQVRLFGRGRPDVQLSDHRMAQGRIRRYGGCGTCQEQLGGRRLGQGGSYVAGRGGQTDVRPRGG